MKIWVYFEKNETSKSNFPIKNCQNRYTQGALVYLEAIDGTGRGGISGMGAGGLTVTKRFFFLSRMACSYTSRSLLVSSLMSNAWARLRAASAKRCVRSGLSSIFLIAAAMASA